MWIEMLKLSKTVSCEIPMNKEQIEEEGREKEFHKRE